ncbi:hypothetical protein DBIPINDM_007328 (plasmid) [Mesorhizobium sp. AR02]|uniref:hypothetical protein n=1 Tax=Mesorhizobium sp. AR02 TaxID=2865837 RepID=UPI00215F04C7|nr:hypothetical protein [Mesorhizobium sp. AR02]UVK50064.1 hypothetical protein DBIPINDM_007328 [Mesorhizobium sp. AR02]
MIQLTCAFEVVSHRAGEKESSTKEPGRGDCARQSRAIIKAQCDLGLTTRSRLRQKIKRGAGQLGRADARRHQAEAQRPLKKVILRRPWGTAGPATLAAWSTAPRHLVRHEPANIWAPGH